MSTTSQMPEKCCAWEATTGSVLASFWIWLSDTPSGTHEETSHPWRARGARRSSIWNVFRTRCESRGGSSMTSMSTVRSTADWSVNRSTPAAG